MIHPVVTELIMLLDVNVVKMRIFGLLDYTLVRMPYYRQCF